MNVEYALDIPEVNLPPFVLLNNFWSREQINAYRNTFTSGDFEKYQNGEYGQSVSVRQHYIAFHEETMYEDLKDAFKVANEWYKFCLSGIVENARFVRYEIGDHNDWHQDYYRDDYSKLSLSIALSDSDTYTGGCLEFMNYNSPTLQAGDAIVFPSYLAHRVTPVENGVRDAIVAWCAGERFR